MTSYCVICDAPPGGCDHNGRRYLDPIAYEPVELPGGKRARRVPDHERARWQNPPTATTRQKPVDEARPVQQLIVELGDWIYFTADLERRLRDTHQGEPQLVTRLVDNLIAEIRAGRITSPGGMLSYRLHRLPQPAGSPFDE